MEMRVVDGAAAGEVRQETDWEVKGDDGAGIGESVCI